MFIYWAGFMTGKGIARDYCLLNEIPLARLTDHMIKIIDNIKTTVDIDGKWYCTHRDTLYSKKEGFKYTKIYTNSNVKKSYIDLENEAGLEPEPYIDNRMTPKRNDYNIIENNYKPYDLPFSLKSIDVHKCAVIGISIPTKYPELVRQLVSFREHTHILPYRNINDPKLIIPTLNAWLSKSFNYEYSDVFDHYNKNKDSLFHWIAQVWANQRNIERDLKKYNVDIKYYDMNTWNLSSVLPDSMTRKIPNESKSYPNYDLSDPVVKERYEKCWDIGEEFLKVTGLTDTRLEFRAKDGI